MSKRRAKNTDNLNAPKPGNIYTDGQARARFTSEPLRREAERGWEESDRSAAKGIERRNNKARAHKRRRQTTREKDQLIARLTQKVARLEAELAKHLKRRQDN
jgi:hypothetical protein